MDTAVQAALDAKYSTCQTLHGGHSCRATVKMPAESTKEQKIAQFQGKYYDNMKVVDTHHRSFHFIQRACTITMFSGRASFWGNAYSIPYASGREIRVQKFGNAYKRKEIESMPLFKSTFSTKFIRRFGEMKCSSQTMRAILSQTFHIQYSRMIVCVMFCLRCVETESRFFAYAVRIASMIMRTIRRNLR